MIVKHKLPTSSVQFWLVAAFITAVFILGGTSRPDVQSLTVLRPLSVLVCGIAILTIKNAHIRGRFWTLGSFAAMLALTSLHLFPMSASVQLFSGRNLISEIDVVAGLGDTWRPLSQVPIAGWEAFFTLFTPLAMILLCLQLSRDELFRLLPIVIGLGTLSGIFGILQAAGDPQGPFYLYRITNNGVAVGLFANRNHGAVFLACLFPMLAVLASNSGKADNERRTVRLVSAAIGIVLIPLILVTGSRSGVFLAIFGMLGAAGLYGPSIDGVKRKSAFVGIGGMNRNTRNLILAIFVICLSLLTLLFSRAQAIERLFRQSFTEEARFDFWSVSVEIFWKYFPLGAGSASFAQSFQIDQPISLLNAAYLNRAHNDWLETVTNFGLLGVAFLAVIAVLFVRKTYHVWIHCSGAKRSTTYARMATLLIGMVGFASFSDYPLRTPAFMSLAVVMLLWLAEARHDRRQNRVV